jgi:hypothetical protein
MRRQRTVSAAKFKLLQHDTIPARHSNFATLSLKWFETAQYMVLKAISGNGFEG